MSNTLARRPVSTGRKELALSDTVISPNRYRAILFDLDGVLTPTARIHAAAWKQVFDGELEARADEGGPPFVPFDKETDYLRYVDGKPRLAGVESFLGSRGIELPEGSPGDPPELETAWGVGNRKDAIVKTVLERDGIDAYPGSLALVRAAKAAGIKVAVVSSSKNCAAVLETAGILDLFDARVDGIVAEGMALAGKPAPDTYEEGAHRVGAPADASVVIEDALSGVESGRNGGFGLVIGVDRGAGREALLEHGANVVVSDLAELSIGSNGGRS